MSVFSLYKKESHLHRAELLLDSENTTDHVYACLELRFCIEAIVYQKLLHGIKNIPSSIVETWQPQKAVKMLSEIDELTTGDCKIEFNLTKKDTPPKDGWLLLGEQKIPPVKWLAKNYNKLGNFLHLVEPKKAQNEEVREIKETISPIAEQLKEYVKGDLVLTINNIEINQCPVCHQDFAFATNQVKHGHTRKCSNFKCGALFTANIDAPSKKITFTFKTYDVACQKCEQTIVIPEEKIRNLDKFSCSNCHSQYIPKGEYGFALFQNES
ncbi:MAG TPA: hypothetical protein DEO86_06955 [Colwellia sp.]|nr:hypothetical protein [Colwellia sp.]|tara:strand:- start:1330 stop:2136 length:807 start_codon:yes stop_codon:yes gene_type:complete